MKIVEVTDEGIYFDNGSEITFYHSPQCCEYNYADFKQIEEMALDVKFPNDLIFEVVDGCGFRFGGANTHKFFIPCYSEQNGYYSDEIEVYFNGKKVFDVCCELKLH